MNVHCYNYEEYLIGIQNVLTSGLNYDVASHITKYLAQDYQNQLQEDLELKKGYHMIKLDITHNVDCIGMKYGGSRNYKRGKAKGAHGVFVSEIIPNSAADMYRRLNGFDFTGFEIVRYNSYKLCQQNEKNNIDELKKYVKMDPKCTAYLKLKWNPDLLEKFEYFD